MSNLLKQVSFVAIPALFFTINPAVAKICQDGSTVTVTGVVDRNWSSSGGAIYAKKYSEEPCEVGRLSLHALKDGNGKYPSHIAACKPGDRFTATGKAWVTTDYGLLHGMTVKKISCETQ